jgi:hypothetical protein
VQRGREFISKDKEYQVLKIAASKAWPTTHAALCISQDRSGSCLWVVANKSKLTSDVVEAASGYRSAGSVSEPTREAAMAAFAKSWRRE